jgi:hypothetical protein
VIQFVHNYRFACANGLYFRDGRVCQDCLGKRVPWPAVTHSCYLEFDATERHHGGLADRPSLHLADG